VEIRNAAGVPITALPVGIIREGINLISSIRLVNVGAVTLTNIRLNAMVAGGHWGADSNAHGLELVTLRVLEGRLSGGAWTPFGGNASQAGNYLDIPGPIAPAAEIDVELRANVPGTLQTTGDVTLLLEVFDTDAS